MPLVNVIVNERSYAIACDTGDEEHLQRLASHVDAKARELAKSVGSAGEQRLLLMAALVIADEYFDAAALAENRAEEIVQLSGAQDVVNAEVAATDQKAALAVTAAARRVEDIAARLAEA
jgi:cell division protein ZapA